MTTPESPSERDDDLFAPSLTQTEQRRLPAGDRPWRLGSQFYVAFFGGPLAAGTIGYLNGKRLGLTSGRLAAIAAFGVAGFIVAVAASVALVDAGAGPRLSIAIAGVATYVAARELQKEADRSYGLNRDEEEAYDSLWIPGLAAVLVFGFLSAAVVAAVR